MSRETSNGSKASYYDLPEGAKVLGDLIAYRNLNHAYGEIFCAIYRSGRASHSDELRDARKVLYYAQSEVRRLEALDQTRDEREFPLVCHAHPDFEVSAALEQAPTACQAVCFSHAVPTLPARMSWQDVAKLSAVHPVYIRESDGKAWGLVRPMSTPIDPEPMAIRRGDVWFELVESIEP